MTNWLRRIAIGVAILAITTHWVNERIAMLLVNQNPAHPLILDTYRIYHVMAMGMREGRIGQVNLSAVQRYSALKYHEAYERSPGDAQQMWANYYTLDIGYSFIVEAARLAFPGLPDNHLRSLVLQFVADAALVLFVFFVFSHWNIWVGLLAAYLYSSNYAFSELVSFAFYYYWDVPLTFVVLGSLVLAFRRPAEGARWLTFAAVALGFGVWLRGSWWPLSLFLLAVASSSPVLRKGLLVPVVAFTIIATPQVVRSSVARGELTFSTRAVWHVAMVGLGYYPNAYGLELKDVSIFKLTRDKYGVAFNQTDYYLHDQAAKKEFLSIWSRDRSFVIHSFLGRLQASIMGSTESSVPSFQFLSNLTYRLLCVTAFCAMILRGGEKRLLAVASGGLYAIYVVLTSVFFYVGLAYSSVSEMTLFVLFIGGIDAMHHAARRILAGWDPPLPD